MTTEYVASKDENNLSNYSSTNNPLPALKLMSISQVAKSLRLGRDTVKSLINQGKIGVLQIGKRSRIPLAEIEKFISTETQKIVSVKEEPLISKRDLDMFLGVKKKSSTPRHGAEIWAELVGEC